MPDPKKLLGAFFGNLIQGIGKRKYQNFITEEQERLGEKKMGQDRQTKLLDSALEKFLDPDTPYMERVKWGQFYQQQTGLGPTAGPEGAGTGDFGYALPTPSPVGPGVTSPPGGEVTKPLNQTDFLFGPEETTREQDFLKSSAEIDKVKAGADAATALAESRRADAAATKKGKPPGTTKADLGPEKLELDKLKAQFGQLNSQYDDLAKLIPKDIYGNFSVDQEDPRVQALNRIDTERNNVYQKMYGGEKKIIKGF